MPELVASEDLTEMQNEMHGDIQEILRTSLPRTTDNRIYRAIVLKPYLIPLVEIPDFEVFYRMFKRLVDGGLRKLEEIPKANIIAYLSVHYDVYRRGKVLHRDINPQNLMIKCEKSGTYSLFLIDFDFAIQSDQNGLNWIRTHRTMSTPFLAGELLTENAVPARYRHDLEAFFWTFWWISVTYRDGKQIKTKALEGWSRGKGMDIYYQKAGMISRRPDWKSVPTTRNMEGAKPILTLLAKLFRKVYRSLTNKDYISLSDIEGANSEEKTAYDDETAGGILTYESFRSCLV